MKRRLYTSIALLAVCLLTTTLSEAAFIIKRDKVKTELGQPAPESASVEVAGTTTEVPVITTPEATTVKSQSVITRFFNKIVRKHKAAIDQVLYIILAIFPLGWLGMGLNDNFQGNDWLISLLLYIVLWLPGLIFTLIKMDKYY